MTEFAVSPADGDAVREMIHHAHSLAEPIAVGEDPDEPSALIHIIPENYRLAVSDLTKFREIPERKTGHTILDEADSFIRFVQRHAEPFTTLYADARSASVRAVLNGHRTARPGWGDHTATLTLEHTPEWLAWAGVSGKWQTQEQFANFVEDHSHVFQTPSAAVMLELAQTFEAKVGAEFESGSRLDNGQRQVVYKETVAARAGQRGTLEVPAHLLVGLRPFKGGKGYNLKVFLRYRITGGNLALMVKIDRIEDALDTAFAETVAHIEDSIEVEGLMLVHGTASR